MSTRPHNGWWQASNVPRRWLDQLKSISSHSGKSSAVVAIAAAQAVPAQAVPRLHVMQGRLQQV